MSKAIAPSLAPDPLPADTAAGLPETLESLPSDLPPAAAQAGNAELAATVREAPGDVPVT